MPTLLRIVLLVGNIGFLISSCIVFIGLIFNSTTDSTKPFLVLIPLIILFILNIYCFTGPFSLYLKRKRLEEEVKIQEAENKLKELKLIGLSSSKEKNQRAKSGNETI